MKKKLGGTLGVVVILVVVWFVAREKAADSYSGDYLSKREIPYYHWLSAHTAEDRNTIGYCKPCGSKARDVIAKKVGAKADELEKAINGK